MFDELLFQIEWHFDYSFEPVLWFIVDIGKKSNMVGGIVDDFTKANLVLYGS